MPLVPFAKARDLRVLAPSVSVEKAELVLELVSGVIRSSVRWDVDEHTATYTTMLRQRRTHFAPREGGSPSVVLPAMNLTAVASVIVDTHPLTADQWDATTAGIVYLNGVVAYKSITVTYTAGFKRAPADQAPPVFRAVALDLATKYATVPTGVASYSMGSTQESFVQDALNAADEDVRLDPYRVEPL